MPSRPCTKPNKNQEQATLLHGTEHDFVCLGLVLYSRELLAVCQHCLIHIHLDLALQRSQVGALPWRMHGREGCEGRDGGKDSNAGSDLLHTRHAGAHDLMIRTAAGFHRCEVQGHGKGRKDRKDRKVGLIKLIVGTDL